VLIHIYPWLCSSFPILTGYRALINFTGNYGHYLPYRRLNELEAETGFCQKLRKSHAVIFLQVLIISSSLHKYPTLAEIWRRYTDLTESDISYSIFVARFEDKS